MNTNAAEVISNFSYYDASSNSSRISTSEMQKILNKLKSNTTRKTTASTYLCVWRQFNNFIIKLDKRPSTWEERISLFGAFLVQTGKQSCTIRSYYSAIKAVLRDDDYLVDDKKVLLTSLVKACKLVNDKVRTRLPIQRKLMELLLFEMQRIYANQPYLETLFKTIMLLSYYGMFRIGELTTGDHAVKACNVHIGENKDKMLFVLFSSKTHSYGQKPQKIKISANDNYKISSFFCPFRSSREYLALRGNYKENDDPFFIFRDQQPVKPSHVRAVLKTLLESVNLNPSLYGHHSFRIGRSVDLVTKHHWSIDRLKSAGRWKSNTVYKYIKDV